MTRIKCIIIIMVILLMASCKKPNDPSSLILGEWELIQIYGPMPGSTVGWFTPQGSPIQTIKFSSNGNYALAADGNTACNGTFVFESKNSVRMNPSNCMPLMQSVETIYKLTQDTLTISNRSSSVSSFSDRKDKYIRK